VAGGVLAIRAAAGFDRQWAVPLCLVCILLMTLANLRGVKESGRVFAVPTYIYIGALGCFIGYALYQKARGQLEVIPVNHEDLRGVIRDHGPLVGGISAYIFARAFASGAVALSGVEAISNGIPAFEKPTSKNAAQTLVWMAVILGTAFFAISFIGSWMRPTPSETESALSIMGRALFGGDNPLYYVLQFSTMAILILAANTAYADYPRLSSIIAKDGYLPHQFANRGDRLVYSNGIIFLAGMAIVLEIAFGGNVSKLIPLYAVGVFTGFTLSQTGMVVHHYRHRAPSWKWHSVINGVGAFATLTVTLIVVIVKFQSGAWVPAAIIPLLVLMFSLIHRHYERVRKFAEVEPGFRPQRRTHCVVVLVNGVNKGVMEAVGYARSLAPDKLIALSVAQSAEDETALQQNWDRYDMPIELHTIASPYRELTRPIMEFLDDLNAQDPDDIITVVIPEFVTSVPTQWLHNQSGLAIKARLLYRPNTVVTSVPVVVD
jgi:amino acid transporter